MRDLILVTLTLLALYALIVYVFVSSTLWRALRRNKETKFILGQKVYFIAQQKVTSGIITEVVTTHGVLSDRRSIYKLTNMPEMQEWEMHDNKEDLIKSL